MLMVTQKLLHYFTNHEVTVVTSYLLGEIVHNCDADLPRSFVTLGGLPGLYK